MSDQLRDAVTAAVEQDRPQALPSFDGLVRRSRQRRRARAGIAAGSAVIVGGAFAGVLAAGPFGAAQDELAVPAVPPPPTAAPTASPFPSPSAVPLSKDGPFLLQNPPDVPARGYERTWDSARTDDGGTAVVLSFVGARPGTGPCEQEHTGEARAAGDTVVVSVTPTEKVLTAYTPPPPGQPETSCGDIGYTRNVRVELPGPLAGRPLVDAKSGRPGPLFDGDALPRPPAPPDGYTIAEEGGSEGGPTWYRNYRAGGDGPLLTVIFSSGPPEPPAGMSIATAEVRGQQVEVREFRDGQRLISRSLAWSERGGHVLVSNAVTRILPDGTAQELLTADDLVAFARSLR